MNKNACIGFFRVKGDTPEPFPTGFRITSGPRVYSFYDWQLLGARQRNYLLMLSTRSRLPAKPGNLAHEDFQ